MQFILICRINKQISRNVNQLRIFLWQFWCSATPRKYNLVHDMTCEIIYVFFKHLKILNFKEILCKKMNISEKKYFIFLQTIDWKSSKQNYSLYGPASIIELKISCVFKKCRFSPIWHFHNFLRKLGASKGHFSVQRPQKHIK